MTKVGNALNNAIGSYELLSVLNLSSSDVQAFTIPSSPYNNFQIVFNFICTGGQSRLGLTFSTNSGSSYITSSYLSYLKTLTTVFSNTTSAGSFLISPTSLSVTFLSGFISLYNMTSGSGDISGLSQCVAKGSQLYDCFSSCANPTNLSSVVVTNVQLDFSTGSPTGYSGYACLYGIKEF
jgi:hypothetical protein